MISGSTFLIQSYPFLEYKCKGKEAVHFSSNSILFSIARVRVRKWWNVAIGGCLVVVGLARGQGCVDLPVGSDS